MIPFVFEDWYECSNIHELFEFLTHCLPDEVWRLLEPFFNRYAIDVFRVGSTNSPSGRRLFLAGWIVLEE
jgi:hypothetical protein